MNQNQQHPVEKAVHHIPAKDPRLSLKPRLFDISCHETKDDEQFEINFFENILAEDPCNEDVLMFLGHAYTRRGNYKMGLTLDQRLARLRPADPTAFYNLACSYSLLQQTNEALSTLEKALSLGYNDFPHILKDPDLENLRNSPRFRGLIARLLKGNPNDS